MSGGMTGERRSSVGLLASGAKGLFSKKLMKKIQKYRLARRMNEDYVWVRWTDESGECIEQIWESETRSREIALRIS